MVNTKIVSNIINVDFIEKSSIVPYCISANRYKAERLNDKQPPSQPTVYNEFFVDIVGNVQGTIEFFISDDLQ